MTKNKLKGFLVLAFLVIAICCATPTGNNTNSTGNTNTRKLTASTAPCNVSATWISNPAATPSEIPTDDPNFMCDFNEFSWRWFLALMNQPDGTADRAFQVEQNYPLLLVSDQSKTAPNSCVENPAQTSLFVRTNKNDNGPHDDFILPENLDQAGHNVAVIYDQNGNVVLYEVRFSRSQCALAQSPTPPKMFPPLTTEMKISYRVITEADKPYYVWINADIKGKGGTVETAILGMVGFHLVISTEQHPEFIWASFEHKQTAPECLVPPAANAPAWAFTSAQCAAQLPNSVDAKVCNFNLADTATVLKGGKPTQICKVYHAGTKPNDPSDPFGAQSVGAIDSLNSQLTGPNGLIAKTAAGGSLAVLQNYQLIGTLWLQDTTKPSPTNCSDTSNQIGSLQLANPTMETTFQQFTVDNPSTTCGALPVGYTGNTDLKPAANCFFCHRYEPGNNVKLSHIFSEILGVKPATPTPTANTQK